MIKIYRTHLEVDNYDWKSCPSLEYMFAVWNYATYQYDYVGISWDPETRKLYLPRGMDVRKVESLLRRRAVVMNEYDKWEGTGPVLIKYTPKNETQKKAIKFILGMAEYNYTVPYSQLAINLMTGKGKTYVTIASIMFDEAKFIVITSIKGWLNQWEEKVLEYTNFKKKNIMNLTSNLIDKIIKDECDLSKIKMFKCTHKTIKNYGDTNGWDKIEILFSKIKVKYKVFDEAHLYFDCMAMIDFHSNTYKTLYVTASPYRSDEKENQIYARYFEYVPSIELYNKDKDAMTDYLSVHYNSHPTPRQQALCRNKFGFIKSAYVEYAISNEWFWKIVYIIFCEAILPNKGRTLLLTETNHPIPVLKEWIEENFPEFRGQIGTFNGDTSEQERQSAKNQRLVITNRQCGGTCLDIPDLGLCFPLLVPAKSKVTAQQLFGRVGREGTVLPKFLFIELVDEGFKKLKEYHANKMPVYMKYATSVKKVIYRDFDIDQGFNKWTSIRSKPKLIEPPWRIVIPKEEEPKKLIEPPWRIKL